MAVSLETSSKNASDGSSKTSGHDQGADDDDDEDGDDDGDDGDGDAGDGDGDGDGVCSECYVLRGILQVCAHNAMF